MAEVTYGPKGTTLIQVGKVFYLAVDIGSSILYWELGPTVDLSTITNINPEFSNVYDSTGKLVVGDSIEGFLYISQEDWDNQTFNNDRLVAAGSILEIQPDRTNDIELTIAELNKMDERLPYAKDQDFLDLVVELRTEDKNNWRSTIETDPRFYEIINKYGMSLDMYKLNKAAMLDKVAFGNTKESYAKIIKNAVESIGGKLSQKAYDYAASKWAMGQWTQSKAIDQAIRAVDPNLDIKQDTQFGQIVASGDFVAASLGEQNIIQLMNTWLPKQMHSKIDVAYEASKIRQNAIYEYELVESFKDMRFQGGYDMYDRDFTWSNIISPILSRAQNIWGITANEEDSTIQELIVIKDPSKQEEILRAEGLKRGYQQTEEDLISNLTSSMGIGASGVIPISDYSIGGPRG